MLVTTGVWGPTPTSKTATCSLSVAPIVALAVVFCLLALLLFLIRKDASRNRLKNERPFVVGGIAGGAPLGSEGESVRLTVLALGSIYP